MKDSDKIYITLPRKRPFKNVFQFRITLIGTDPPVWRRIVVPENYTFYDLHVAIQDAMGWLDYHLHDFEIRDEEEKGRFIRLECPWTEPDLEEDDWLRTTEVPLKKYFKKTGNFALYNYDYGDGWQLEIFLEDIYPREKNKEYPICLDGDLSGPPEDCGGISGYYECIEALMSKDDSEGLLTWLGDWKPDDFDPKTVVFESPRKRIKKALED
ncbi:MAG: plasmid pRiA4b ORF-3 family protein [Acidobacteriota bacterium]|nr:plasmid pRiA4b ORF-3 family protein [Acidobacteriota bacterium]MDW3228909.1 plasmid pRiA4b ORF-3 family protein [Acidobacteriota bacterium]